MKYVDHDSQKNLNSSSQYTTSYHAKVYEMMNHTCHTNLGLCITNTGHASLEIHITGKQELSCPQNSLFILSNWIIQIAKKCRFSFKDSNITSYNHSYAYVLELVQIYGPLNVHKVSCDCVAHRVQVQSVSQLPWHCDVLLTHKHALHMWKCSLNYATCPSCVISDTLHRLHFLSWWLWHKESHLNA